MASEKIGFIGAGQMARAIAQGLVRAGMIRREQIFASDPDAQARAAFEERVPGANVGALNLEVVSAADTIILAIKPQQMAAVVDGIALAVDDSKLLISIAAGVKLSQLSAQLGDRSRLIRVMPNTPCLIGEGVSGYALGAGATAEDADFADRMLRSVGHAFLLEEKLLDAVTALSGSGPA
ncbi:MAG TPA: NAD(P)-binding domain-containing protein, partial [Pirellulales bacterium]|nr:NAD(P)-binding domain-containing protein [Pirellulales bacterium]